MAFIPEVIFIQVPIVVVLIPTNQDVPPYIGFQRPPPHNFLTDAREHQPTHYLLNGYESTQPSYLNFPRLPQTFDTSSRQPYYTQQPFHTRQPHTQRSYTQQPYSTDLCVPNQGRETCRHNNRHTPRRTRSNRTKQNVRCRSCQNQPIRSRPNDHPDIIVTNTHNVLDKIDLISMDLYKRCEGNGYHRSDTVILFQTRPDSIPKHRSEDLYKKEPVNSSKPPRRTCENCKGIETRRGWCNCYKTILEKCYENWTSGYKIIDDFIHKTHQEATSICELLEWIPYDRLKNIEYSKKGGIGIVYSGTWCGGRIQRWDNNSGDWLRNGEEKVALKSLGISREISHKFLSELEKYYACTKRVSHVLRSFGVTKDPKSDELYMVMEWAENGNLMEYLHKNGRKMTFENKLNILVSIAKGLKTIHNAKLVHGDLHSGNILINGKGWVLIGDMGFSKCYENCEANKTKDQRNVYGVMPYIAPEVLNLKPYTPAADIYSFGMLMYETYHEYPPFFGRNYDTHLAMDIMDGKRPKCYELIQKDYFDLMARCWADDAKNRPSAREIVYSLNCIRSKNLGYSKNHNMRIDN